MPRLEDSAAYRPKRIYSLPSHNSKTVLSTVYVGGPCGNRTHDFSKKNPRIAAEVFISPPLCVCKAFTPVPPVFPGADSPVGPILPYTYPAVLGDSLRLQQAGIPHGAGLLVVVGPSVGYHQEIHRPFGVLSDHGFPVSDQRVGLHSREIPGHRLPGVALLPSEFVPKAGEQLSQDVDSNEGCFSPVRASLPRSCPDSTSPDDNLIFGAFPACN